tara:strand:+ start:626 stop:931 length:306 start_codon:yes stop_codon:yes gene_type:complete
MSYKIIASPLANTSYLNNIDYLENCWTEKEIIQFIKKTDQVIDILKEAPNTFKTWYLDSKIHHIVIVKQITLYYEIENNNVHLLLFFNNYQEPDILRKLLL